MELHGRRDWKPSVLTSLTSLLATFFISAGIGQAGDLGGGYQGARWGMSPEQVKEVLQKSMKVELQTHLSDAGTLWFGIVVGKYPDGGTETRGKILCSFRGNRLYRVVVDSEPAGYDRESLPPEAYLKALVEKYGDAMVSHGEHVWEDDTTQITFSKNTTGGGYEYADITYESKAIRALMDREEAERREKEERERENRAKSLKDQL